MARMFPDDIEDCQQATEGEKRVFRFLKEASRPDGDFICCYEPLIGNSGKEPDFILFGKKSGLVVIEVKDWTSKQIVSYNPHQFTVSISGKRLKKTNPDKQAKDYVDTIKEKLFHIPQLLTDDIKYKGTLNIPIGRMVAFPNISWDDYANSDFRWLLDSDRVILKDDLEPTGELLCDITGKAFYKKIVRVYPSLP